MMNQTIVTFGVESYRLGEPLGVLKLRMLRPHTWIETGELMNFLLENGRAVPLNGYVPKEGDITYTLTPNYSCPEDGYACDGVGEKNGEKRES